MQPFIQPSIQARGFWFSVRLLVGWFRNFFFLQLHYALILRLLLAEQPAVGGGGGGEKQPCTYITYTFILPWRRHETDRPNERPSHVQTTFTAAVSLRCCSRHRHRLSSAMPANPVSFQFKIQLFSCSLFPYLLCCTLQKCVVVKRIVIWSRSRSSSS